MKTAVLISFLFLVCSFSADHSVPAISIQNTENPNFSGVHTSEILLQDLALLKKTQDPSAKKKSAKKRKIRGLSSALFCLPPSEVLDFNFAGEDPALTDQLFNVSLFIDGNGKRGPPSLSL